MCEKSRERKFTAFFLEKLKSFSKEAYNIGDYGQNRIVYNYAAG